MRWRMGDAYRHLDYTGELASNNLTKRKEKAAVFFPTMEASLDSVYG